MKNKLPSLVGFVVDAVSNDYEDLHCVSDQVTNWFEPFTESELIDALECAIREGYVLAYRLSTREPYSQAVAFSRELVHDLWFYVTPRGRELVRVRETEGGEQN